MKHAEEVQSEENDDDAGGDGELGAPSAIKTVVKPSTKKIDASTMRRQTARSSPFSFDISSNVVPPR
jgi:hypothetical protein